jgi:hypothetical protein
MLMNQIKALSTRNVLKVSRRSFLNMKSEENVILNKYSRTITEPPSQGIFFNYYYY